MYDVLRCQEQITPFCVGLNFALLLCRILCRLSTNPVNALLVMLLYSNFMSASLSQASVWSVEMAVNMYGKQMKFIPNLKGLALKE